MTNCNYDSPINWDRGHYAIKIPPNPGGFEPYDHQNDAWNNMSGYFSSTQRGGIIWIPTGGGKTVIGAKWLLENVIDQGYKVIWFAHRGILLEQAAEAFKRLLCGIKLMETKKEVKCAYVISKSQGGTQWKNVKLDTDIVFASLASSTGHISDIEFFGKTAVKGIYIVFDEVQHAYAKTYQTLLLTLKSKFPAWFIGLSATPYRMTKEESIGLWKLFSAYDRSQSTLAPIIRVLQEILIQREILAKPKFHDKRTGIEPIVEEGEKLLNDFNDLTPAVYKNLAENEVRNRLICEYYIMNFLNSQNKEDLFGKTIIFTPDINGNQNLYNTFEKVLKEYARDNAIKVNYIDSTRSESEKKRIIEQYRSTGPNSIDILLNVEMCTEGFDAPLTKTIFLARPSNSETLVRQMIGRAMRGPKAGGNKNCHIVRFVDELPENFNHIDPQVPYKEEGDHSIRFIPLPKDVLDQFKKQFDILSTPIHCVLAYQYNYIPAGWFYFQKFNLDIDNSINPDINPEQTDIKEFYVMYLEPQIYGYDRLAKLISTENRERIQSLDYDVIIEKFFFDCPDPLPTKSNLMKFIELFPRNGDNYETDIKNLFEIRKTLSPDNNFENLIRANKITADIIDDITIPEYEINTHISTFYGSHEELIADIKKHVWYKNNRIISKHCQDDSTIMRSYIRDNNFLDSVFDLESIFNDLENFNGKTLISTTPIRIYKSHFVNFNRSIGFCRFTNPVPEIHISSVLHSRALPRVIIEYIFYHLYLHSIFPYENHGEVFCGRELLFKPSEPAEKELTENPIWDLLKYKPPIISWVEFCRYYLCLFLEENIESIQDSGKTPEQSFIKPDGIDIDAYL